jgi:hypothetical protein
MDGGEGRPRHRSAPSTIRSLSSGRPLRAGPVGLQIDLSPHAGRGERKSVLAVRSLLPHPEAPARSAGLEGCLLQRSARSSFEARRKSAEHLRMRSIVPAAHRLRPSLSHHHQATKRSGRSVESVSCPKRLFSTRFRQKREAERRKAHCPTNVRVKRGCALLPCSTPPFGAHARGTRHRFHPMAQPQNRVSRGGGWQVFCPLRQRCRG